MSASKNLKRPAFVLTEVLVAVSILTVGLVFILSGELRLLRAQDSLFSFQEAVLLAQRSLWEMNYFDVKDKTVSGFNVGVKRLSKEDELFQKKEVEVTWKDRGEEKKIAIETYRLGSQ